jgi:FixJ family two-component response regulator
MDATPEAERQLTLSTALAGLQVQVCVADRGPGIPASELDNVFRPLLEHQGRRHGHRPGDLPLDRRGAPGQPDIVQPAGGRREPLPAAADAQRAMTPTVFIVDDDAPLRRALVRLLREHGWRTADYASAEDFLAQRDPQAPGCLVLDVSLPGLDGLALQRRLAQAGPALPIVFLTGHGDIPMSVQAVKAGAVDFLTKPVAAASLLAAVRAGVDQDARSRQVLAETEALRQRFAGLTQREREVLAALANGKLNKQIAGDMSIVEQTVKFHRARIMARMQARTVAELMHMAARLELAHQVPTSTAPRPD